jgi:hypothetical protein
MVCSPGRDPEDLNNVSVVELQKEYLQEYHRLTQTQKEEIVKHFEEK